VDILKVLTIFLLLLFTVLNGFSNYQAPVADAHELISAFGEARLSNDLKNLRFFMGLGISTNEKTGVLVQTMKAGYVEKIVTHHPYYGTAVFINHSDNTQTRYIALSRLTGSFMKLFEAVNVEFEDLPVTITFNQGEFDVEQGQPIGFTGVSTFFKIPAAYVEIIDLQTNQAINPLSLLKLDLKQLGYGIAFKRIRVNTQEYEFSQGAVYPFTGEKPMVEMLIENASARSEFKFALRQLRVKIDGQQVLTIQMDRIPLDLKDKANRVYGDKTNHQTFWYRLTTPWTTAPVVENEIRKIEAFNDKIKVEVEATDVFGTVQTAEFWLKRR